jgi:hypothetical protein
MERFVDPSILLILVLPLPVQDILQLTLGRRRTIQAHGILGRLDARTVPARVDLVKL